ncbi:MAG: hypothetical protein JO147_02520, partial [Actinobacteria bacterium]|nr:hypothetical protein [Actinomycetota bacterium]
MSSGDRFVLRLRVGLAAVGIAGIGYGAYLVLTDQRDDHPAQLAKWLVGAVVLHDGVLVPVTLGAGFVISRLVPPRAR